MVDSDTPRLGANPSAKTVLVLAHADIDRVGAHRLKKRDHSRFIGLKGFVQRKGPPTRGGFINTQVPFGMFGGKVPDPVQSHLLGPTPIAQKHLVDRSGNHRPHHRH